MRQLSTYKNTLKMRINNTNTNKGNKTYHEINKIKAKNSANALIYIIV